MKIEYDPEANALYISLREGEVHHSEEITESLSVDIDTEGRPLGIEILDVRELVGVESLGHVTLANLLTEPAIP